MPKINVNKVMNLTGHKDCIYTLEKGSNGQFFSAAGDGMVAVWNFSDLENGHLVAKVPNSVYAVHYLRDENQLLVGQNFEGIHLIDVENKKEIKSLKLSKSAIFDIKSLDGKIYIADGSGTLWVVDKKSYTVLKNISLSLKSARSIAINEKRKEIAVGFSDNFIRILDLNDLSLKKAIEAHNNSVFTLRYSPEYKYLLSGSRDAHLKIWDAQRGYEMFNKIVAHMYTINHIDYSPSGKHFVTCSVDKSVKIWDADSFKLLKVIDKARHAGHGTSVNKLYWSDHNDWIISASDDRSISVWDINFNS